MTSRIFPWLLFAWLCVAEGRVLAAEVLTLQQDQAAAVLTGAKVDGDRLEMRLSGTLRLTLSVKGGSTLEVEPPPKVTSAEVWQVRVQGPPTTTPVEEEQVRWQQTFRIDPLQKGEQTLQLEPLRYREDGGTWHEVKWKSVPVTVTTDVVQAAVGEARDITSIEPVPPAPSQLSWLLTASGAAVVPVLALLLWMLWRRPRRLLLAPPEMTALREVESAAAMSLATTQDVERYHSFLSSVVRHYLEERFRLPASRRTTPEFFEAVRGTPHLTAEQLALLQEFLERCDLAKFAPVTPSAQICQSTADLARRFVEDTSSARLTQNLRDRLDSAALFCDLPCLGHPEGGGGPCARPHTTQRNGAGYGCLQDVFSTRPIARTG